MENSIAFRGNDEASKGVSVSQERTETETVKQDDKISDLHLSQVKIMKWSVPKPMDTVAMEKVKQICGALDGDEIYHYENIDDFDDTNEESQRVLRRGKYRFIYCKFFVDENNVCTPSQHCGGRRRRRRFDLEWYIVGEISRGCDTIRCCNKGCPNIYDPWDVVCLLGTKDVYLWYENVAFDPAKGKKKSEIKKQAMKTAKVAPEVDESTQKESKAVEHEGTGDKQTKKTWWRKNKKATKETRQIFVKSESKVFDETIRLYHGDEDFDHQHFKYECETCLTGFDEDPRKETTKCDHYTCSDCLNKYFDNQVTNFITRIECPKPDCHEQYSFRFIKSLLSSGLKEKYIRLYYLRLELEENDKDEAKRLEKVCQRGPGCTKDKCCCIDREGPEWWVNRSGRFAYCPACDTLVEKMNDGGCNNVSCSVCKFSFCWVCKKGTNEANHIMECSLFGNTKYSKKRVVFNYAACATGVLIGGPLIAGIIVGGGLTFVGSAMAAGALAPPYFLSKLAYNHCKKRNSSKTKRILATVGAAGLGVVGMPVLSIWGMCKTMKIVCISTAETLGEWLEEPEHAEKELPDEYNENKKRDEQNTLVLEDVQSPTTVESASSNDLGQHQKPAADEIDNTPGQTELENYSDQVNTSRELLRKPKKRRFSAISENQQGEVPLNVVLKMEAGAQQNTKNK